MQLAIFNNIPKTYIEISDYSLRCHSHNRDVMGMVLWKILYGLLNQVHACHRVHFKSLSCGCVSMRVCLCLPRGHK